MIHLPSSSMDITIYATSTRLFVPPLPSLHHRVSSYSILSLASSSNLNFRKSKAVTRCLADESSGSVVAVPSPSFAVKKKATNIAPGLKGTSIFLVGLNNHLKSSLGKLLADSLRYYYFDSDSLVVEAAGGDAAAEVNLTNDEKGFRESETEVLKQLSSMGRLVVCAGAGAVQSSTNLALLRYGITIWIDIPLDIVAKDLVKGETPPFSPEIPSSGSYSEVFVQLNTLYEKSKRGYATADATVSLQQIANKLGFEDTEKVTTEDITLEVLEEIEKLTRVKRMMEEAARPF